jgi:hypothetical protein
MILNNTTAAAAGGCILIEREALNKKLVAFLQFVIFN